MVSEFKATGVTFPWEKQAMNGENLPDGLGYADQILYLQLRLLYDSLRKGIVDRQPAIKEKKQLLDEHRCHAYREQMGNEWVEQLKVTELARSEYCKNRTIENADKLVEILEGRRFQ